MTLGLAPGAQLLQVGDLAQVDLGRQVSQDRRFERLVVAERPAGERPHASERLTRTFPQEHVEYTGANLEDDCQCDVRGKGGWSGRLSHEVIDSEAKTSMSVRNAHTSPERPATSSSSAAESPGSRRPCAAAEGEVLVLTKGPLLSSNSQLAQGGSPRPWRTTTRRRCMPKTRYGPVADSAGKARLRC